MLAEVILRIHDGAVEVTGWGALAWSFSMFFVTWALLTIADEIHKR